MPISAQLAAVEAARVAVDLDFARALARDWLEASPDVQARLGGLSIPTLVGMVDDYRAAGDEASRVEVSAFLLAAHAPQNIVGRSEGA